MQAEFVSSGVSIPYSSGSAIAAGKVVVIGTHFIGIAKLDFRANLAATLYEGELHLSGLFRIAKITGALALWTRLYWHATGDPVGGTAGTGALTTDPTAGPFAGIVAKAALSADQKVLVELLPNAGPRSPFENQITDPGNAGAIPVTANGTVQIVTTAAQTRTLAVPTHVGQLLALNMKTDGGDCVITVAAAINATGNNTITLNDAGDLIVLQGMMNGANLRWKVVANDGAALSTV